MNVFASPSTAVKTNVPSAARSTAASGTTRAEREPPDSNSTVTNASGRSAPPHLDPDRDRPALGLDDRRHVVIRAAKRALSAVTTVTSWPARRPAARAGATCASTVREPADETSKMSSRLDELAELDGPLVTVPPMGDRTTNRAATPRPDGGRRRRASAASAPPRPRPARTGATPGPPPSAARAVR